jgi:hypothetical protein
MDIRPILKPEDSVVAGIATIAVVYALYSTHVGTATEVGMSPANTGQIDGNIKTCGLTAVAAVSGISLIARDPNIFILGMAAVVVLHAHYRHQAATNPESGMLENPGPAAYQPAENTTPASLYAAA